MGSAAQVDTGNRYAEILQSLKLVPRSAAANKPFYADAAFEQSFRDAAAEIAGGSRHDDGRGIHDSDLRERTASTQRGRRSEWTIPVQMACQHISEEDAERYYLGRRPHSMPLTVGEGYLRGSTLFAILHR